MNGACMKEPCVWARLQRMIHLKHSQSAEQLLRHGFLHAIEPVCTRARRSTPPPSAAWRCPAREPSMPLILCVRVHAQVDGAAVRSLTLTLAGCLMVDGPPPTYSLLCDYVRSFVQ
eukprot:52624-Chlamydomonas_euryale.AAC.2